MELWGGAGGGGGPCGSLLPPSSVPTRNINDRPADDWIDCVRVQTNSLPGCLFREIVLPGRGRRLDKLRQRGPLRHERDSVTRCPEFLGDFSPTHAATCEGPPGVCVSRPSGQRTSQLLVCEQSKVFASRDSFRQSLLRKCGKRDSEVALTLFHRRRIWTGRKSTREVAKGSPLGAGRERGPWDPVVRHAGVDDVGGWRLWACDRRRNYHSWTAAPAPEGASFRIVAGQAPLAVMSVACLGSRNGMRVVATRTQKPAATVGEAAALFHLFKLTDRAVR